LLDTVRPIVWSENKLSLLDQTRLPHECVFIDLDDVESVADAIRNMVVRGAPAIGITAAYGVILAVHAQYNKSPDNWRELVDADLDMLLHSRPTAVNLAWAINRMRRVIETCEGDPQAALVLEAQNIHQQDIIDNKAMGEFGAALIESTAAVLTHCNAGSLATGGFGTALGVIRSAYARNKISRVYADETRPWLQGARLTAWELLQDEIPVTLLVDGAASHLMKQGEVAWVIVGSDRIAANGDVANKIGTYNLAVAARYHGVKFMVVAPTSTIDMSLDNGEQIPIEIRDANEILAVANNRHTPGDAQAWNPVFDVTPAELIDAIVTERGVVDSPSETKMAEIMENT
jgi:methylthioribose-1-phosphate isomerase